MRRKTCNIECRGGQQDILWRMGDATRKSFFFNICDSPMKPSPVRVRAPLFKSAFSFWVANFINFRVHHAFAKVDALLCTLEHKKTQKHKHKKTLKNDSYCSQLIVKFSKAEKYSVMFVCYRKNSNTEFQFYRSQQRTF